MLTNLTPSNRRNPCPICENIQGDCRHLEDATIFCFGFADSKLGEVINSYVCIKEANGHTATFRPHEPGNSSTKILPSIEARSHLRNQKAEEEYQSRLRLSLTPAERHEGYTKLLSHLELCDRTLSDLKQRGFTESQIADCGFKSVKRYQKVQVAPNPLLPGIVGHGEDFQISASSDGYLCPVKNWEGQIIGCQLRLHDEINGGRYRWLSAPAAGASNGTLHLMPENELPLGIFRPPAEVTGVVLVEGVGPKPFLVSQRLGHLVIGAAGGLFTSSPKQLEKYLELAHQEFAAVKELVIYPDAGDVGNENVVARWDKVCQLLDTLGWSYKFGWWSQIYKSDNDVDELIDFSKIQLISAKEFFSIVDLRLQEIATRKQSEIEAEEREKRFQVVQNAKKQLSHITRCPDLVVDVQHLSEVWDLHQPGYITIIRSEAGTGKTESLKPLVENCSALHSWHNRRSLARATAAKLPGVSFKETIESGEKKKHKKVTFCSPSAPQFDPRDLNNQSAVLLLDECDQVFDFNFSNPCNRDSSRPLILSALESSLKAITHAGGIAIAMSADVSQKEINYIEQLVPSCQIRYVLNNYRRKKPKVKIHDRDSPDGLVKLLLKKLKDGIPCFALDDFKNGYRGCKNLAEFVRKELPEIANLVLEIHADSQDDTRVIEFFNNPNEESKKYLFVCCSPSVLSGISITNQWFNNGVFAFCNGILCDSEIKQFLNRIRGAEDIFLWISENGNLPQGLTKDDITAERVKDYYQRNYEKNSKYLLSLKPEYQPIDNSWNSPHFELFCKNQAYRVCCMQFLKKFVIEHLKECGYQVELTLLGSEENEDSEKEIEDKLKGIWQKIELQEAQLIEQSRFLNESEMELVENSIRKQLVVSQELRIAYQKTKMRDDFGLELVENIKLKHSSGEELTGFAALALRNKNRKYLTQLENYYLLTQDISESVERDYAGESRQMQMGERFAGDIRWNARKKFAREKLNLQKFLDPEKWWNPQDYKQECELLTKFPQETKDVFGFSVENVRNGQIFNQLLEQVGMGVESKEIKLKKPNGKRGTYYQRKIKEADWNLAQVYVKHKLELKEQREAEKAARQLESFSNKYTLAEKLDHIQDKESYEKLASKIDPNTLQEAWSLTQESTRDRINSFYEKKGDVQLGIPSITKDSEITRKPKNQVEKQQIPKLTFEKPEEKSIPAVMENSREVTCCYDPENDEILINPEIPPISNALETAYWIDVNVERGESISKVSSIFQYSSFDREEIIRFLSPESKKILQVA